jgi:excisionase family DNA binding protein
MVLALLSKLLYGVSLTIGAMLGLLFGGALAALGTLARHVRHVTANVDEEANAQEWMTAGEIARRLNVPEDWVWIMAGRGEIPYVKTQRGLRGLLLTSRRFRRSEVEAWMAESAKD